MAFCPNCGAQAPGAFCPNCGTAIGGAASPGASAPMPQVSAGGMTDNVAGALCYALGFITGIIFLVLAPYNQNKAIRFHAFQSIFLHASWIAIFFALMFLRLLMHGLGLVTLLFSPLISLAFFALWLFLLISTYQGKKIVLPVIGPLAEQQA